VAAPAAAWRNRIVGSGEEAPDQLVANPANWRTHPAAQRDALRGSLETVGWVQQVIVNRTTGNVIDGHARIEEALSREEATIPVLYVELSPDEEALVLATLDPIGAMAGTDAARLTELLADLGPIDNAGLAALLTELAPFEPKAGLADPDAVPEFRETTVQRGDLFALGDHRLACGDATDAADVARLLDGAAVDMLFTDPPYGVAYVGGTKDRLTIEGDELGAEALQELIAAALLRAELRPGVPWYICAPGGALQLPFLLAVREAGLRMRQVVIWVKDRFVLGRADYHYQHEELVTGEEPREDPDREGDLIAYGFNAGVAHTWNGGRRQSTVWDIERPAASPDHPTQKPVELVRRAILNSSVRAALVYDPFIGSGTTIVAAEQLGRRCYGMEVDPRYVQVVIDRWQAFTGRTAVRLATAPGLEA
jgi:DNA modification methylase